nr:unnamed protein product [Callosobruchus analis]
MANADIEMLIMLVKDQPVLWHRTQEAYRDRAKTRNALRKVFKQLNDKLEEMDQKDENDYGKAIMKKWANIRDSFQRSERRCKACSKSSGSARQPPKTYIYLRPTIEARATDGNFSESAETVQTDECSEDTGDGDDVVMNDVNESPLTETRIFRKPGQQNKRRRIPDPVEFQLISAITYGATKKQLDTSQAPELVTFDTPVVDRRPFVREQVKNFNLEEPGTRVAYVIQRVQLAEDFFGVN